MRVTALPPSPSRRASPRATLSFPVPVQAPETLSLNANPLRDTRLEILPTDLDVRPTAKGSPPLSVPVPETKRGGPQGAYTLARLMVGVIASTVAAVERRRRQDL